PRKLRLAACASVRRVWHLLQDERKCRVIDVAGRFSDGLEPEGALVAAWGQGPIEGGGGGISGLTAAYTACPEASGAAHQFIHNAKWLFKRSRRGGKITREQCALLRDIFPPFRTAKLAPAWLSDTVLRLAAASYEERPLPSGPLAPARLAILADALEDA